MSSRRLSLKALRTRHMARRRRNRNVDPRGYPRALKSLWDAIGATDADPGQYLRLHAAVSWELRFDSTGKMREDKVKLHDLVTDALTKAGANLSRQASGFVPDNPGLNWQRAKKDAVRNCKERPALSTDVLDSGWYIELDRPANWDPEKGPKKGWNKDNADATEDASGATGVVSGQAGGEGPQGEYDDLGDGQSKRGASAERQVSERRRTWGHIPGSLAQLAALDAGFRTNADGYATEKHAEALRETRERRAEREAEKVGGAYSKGPTRKPNSEVSERTLQRREAARRKRRRRREREAERLTASAQKWRRAQGQ